jgi:hypothetical protein
MRRIMEDFEEAITDVWTLTPLLPEGPDEPDVYCGKVGWWVLDDRGFRYAGRFVPREGRKMFMENFKGGNHERS